mmetsp:Transcript_59052/g.175584  ORF Transcript_59052/g.175584 Transcript_59052/m.175584 type:complete len:215 (-) Transcript_59052:260-904(-)
MRGRAHEQRRYAPGRGGEGYSPGEGMRGDHGTGRVGVERRHHGPRPTSNEGISRQEGTAGRLPPFPGQCDGLYAIVRHAGARVASRLRRYDTDGAHHQARQGGGRVGREEERRQRRHGAEATADVSQVPSGHDGVAAGAARPGGQPRLLQYARERVAAAPGDRKVDAAGGQPRGEKVAAATSWGPFRCGGRVIFGGRPRRCDRNVIIWSLCATQ